MRNSNIKLESLN